MKRLFAILLAVVFALQPASVLAEDTIFAVGSEEKKFTGLYRIDPVKTPLGGHIRFDNVYLLDGALRSVKGRDRLTTSGATDTTVKGVFYYENAAGSVKKILVKEADEIVSYTTAGASRTSLVSGLTSEWVDYVQIGDTVYITSATDGIYVWKGTGSAAALGAVSTPSAVDFSAAATVGGLTSGLDAIVRGATASTLTCTDCACSATSCDTNCFDSNFIKTCATTSTYKYKVTKYNKKWGIESEPSALDSVTLTGGNNVSAYTGSPAAFTVSGAETSTTGTLAAAPGEAYDSYRIYRTVASGDDYFLLGDSIAFSAAYIDGKPDVALGNQLDTTLDTITPPSLRYIDEYKGSIIVGENTQIRFSRLPIAVASSADTYWLETDYIDIGTTEPITGMQKTADSLLIFTANAIKELTGFGAVSFRLKNAVDNIGAVSDETIEVDFQGDVIFFAGTSGVFKLRTFDQPQVDATGESVENNRRVNIQRISSPMLDKVFEGTDSQIDLTPSDYTLSHAYYDKDQDLYFLYIGQECFIYDNKNNYWAHMPATKMKASVWRQSPSGLGVGVLADNMGFLYNNWTGYETGIESGTVLGVASSGASLTLTDSSATFNTTGDGLAGNWIFLDNESNDDEGEWRQIMSNTADVITASGAWDTNPAVGDEYYVSHVIPHLQTKWYSFGEVPEKTTANWIYLIHGKSETSQDLDMDILSYVDLSTTATNAKTFDLTTNYVDKIGTKGFGYWHSWEGKTYIYNISNTIEPPLNILEYGLTGEVVKET